MSAASPDCHVGSGRSGFLVIHSETGDWVRSEPGGGRLQHIPLGQDAGQPGTLHDDGRAHPAFTIMLVTSATDRSAEVVRTSVVMMSRSWITHALHLMPDFTA